MNLLLDTNAFFYMLREPERLSAVALEAIQSLENELFLSSVSCCELLQKHAAGKLQLPISSQINLSSMRETLGVRELPFDEASALRLLELPRHHRDPFDRMIVCQGIQFEMPIVSADRALRAYPVQVVW